MKYLLLLALLGFIGTASADQYVNGYYRKDGTYVQPYYRSDPDGNPYNNYSTKGNINPHTGERGYKNPGVSGDGYSSGRSHNSSGTSLLDSPNGSSLLDSNQ
jgi:hypothetical protein